jgi:hypothetical protein
MALFVTLPANIDEKVVKALLATQYPGSTATHWVDDFEERDENGNFRELNLAIPGPPVSKEYWEWHMANIEKECEDESNFIPVEELKERMEKFMGRQINAK